MQPNNKIIVILGPTASGKSDVAVKLAKRFNGEVISADSRQIYRGMNIGTGKITKKEMAGIKHWMLDIVSPKTKYNVAKFKKQADKIIENILKRQKVPIICGGTGFWIKAIVDNVNYPAVKPDWKLRKKLEKYNCVKLIDILGNLDPRRLKTIDSNNKVRIIRAIEIAKTLSFVPDTKYQIQNTKYQFLQIGIKLPKEKLYQNIKKRLDARLKQGMIREVKNLHHKHGVSWKRLESFGLEYKWIALYLQNKITEKEMKEKLLQEIKNYAKRQMTWFQKDKRIEWIVSYTNIEKKIKKFSL
jgi:tRNA dimethylallyltransferase